MKRASTLVAACAALGILVMSTSAIAAYNAPRDAKRLAIEMVPVYNQCTVPTLTHRPTLALPACAPAQSSANNPANVYTFGHNGNNRRGAARITIEPTNGDVTIAAKSDSIRKNGAQYRGSGDLTGAAILRVTDNGCGVIFDTDCTMVDFPFPVDLNCTSGSCKAMAPTANGILAGAIHAGDKSSIAIGQITINDEDGDAFLHAGIVSGFSYASAAFNTPRNARRLESSMVPAVNQCTVPTMSHRPALALPACVPTPSSANNPTNVYTFGQSTSGADDGSASVTIRASAGQVRLTAKSRAIWRNGVKYTGDDLTATTVVRKTDNGCGAAFDVDCTVVDFPFSFGLECTNGSCHAAGSSWNAILPGSDHPDDTSNLEIGPVSIVDQDGDTVAKAGVLVK
jgi:hypothetical protein